MVLCSRVDLFQILLGFQLIPLYKLAMAVDVRGDMVPHVQGGEANGEEVDDLQGGQIIDELKSVLDRNTVSIVVSLGEEFPVSQISSHSSSTW